MQINFTHVLLVGLGGMAGSVCRYLTSGWLIQQVPSHWPWGTFVVNLSGCLMMGIVLGIPWKPHENQCWSLLLASGFCGGFTTFSAFSNEGLLMLRHQLYGMYVAYALSSIVLGLLAVALGYFISRFFS